MLRIVTKFQRIGTKHKNCIVYQLLINIAVSEKEILFFFKLFHVVTLFIRICLE